MRVKPDKEQESEESKRDLGVLEERNKDKRGHSRDNGCVVRKPERKHPVSLTGRGREEGGEGG
jgi:hypothetical protein